MATRGNVLRLVAGAIIVIAIVAIIAFPTQTGQALELPLMALFSVVRLAASYMISLLFAISFGTLAATNKRAREIILPFVNIMQSVPILGFFPAALVFFVATFQGHWMGIELASIFLIFTCMAWNMIFGVYEAISTTPRDLEESATAFAVRGWQRFRRLMLPVAIPSLIYNSIISWANGWFFLVASEVFTAFGETYTRPGIGSFIARAGVAGNVQMILVGLGVLAAVVLVMDIFLWRPLSLWSNRFRMDVEVGEVRRVPAPFERFLWIPRLPNLRRRIRSMLRPLFNVYSKLSTRLDHLYTAHPKIITNVIRIDLLMFLFIFAFLAIAAATWIVGVLSSPLSPVVSEIPTALLWSALRLLLAYSIAVAWTLPMAVWVGRSERGSRIMTPILELSASIPATALLPVIIGVSVFLATSIHLEAELAALLIALFAMQWYLLFNIISGVKGIPKDLDEAARVFGLRGRGYWRRVLLPSIMPSFMTGSITAWGAGWNAVVVSEYFVFSEKLYHVQGIGTILNRATFGIPPDNELLILAVIAMVVVVLVMDRFLWRPLFGRVVKRYKVEVQ